MKIDTDTEIITLTPENISDYGICGYKDAGKHLELKRKIEWYARYYPLGLRVKALISESGGYQGMIEYIPGEHAHRPVNAKGYMFIHCIFTGFKNEYKGKGYGQALIDECIKGAKEEKMSGVAVVTRKGSFMAKNDIFLKKGFTAVGSAKPDFELLALKFKEDAFNPSFRAMDPGSYPEGLTILRSPQCPYSVKNVNAIIETAGKMGLSVSLIELESAEAAQSSPCPFGTFCIVNDGKVISHHPISNTRFENIMKAGR